MVRKVLKIEENMDLSIIGISSSLKDYQLGHFLSKNLRLDLERVEDLKWNYPKQNRTLFFSKFGIDTGITEQKAFLFNNRSSGVYFLPSLKEFDYLMVWVPGINLSQIKDFLIELKNIPEILEVKMIKMEWIKESERLNEFLF